MEMQNRYSRHELLKEVGVEGNQKSDCQEFWLSEQAV